MNILAIDTSTENCSVALWSNGGLSWNEFKAGQQHSELILPAVDNLLQDAGYSLQDLDGIAFAEGPGSFTGLRIGCGVAQGLAYAMDLPVVGISTLLALAQATQLPKVVACLDARMGEIYHAAYKRNPENGNAWEIVCQPSLCTAADAPMLPGNDWHGSGSGFAVYGAELVRRYKEQLLSTDGQRLPSAKEVAVLSVPHFAAQSSSAAHTALPVYIRNKVALQTSERK